MTGCEARNEPYRQTERDRDTPACPTRSSNASCSRLIRQYIACKTHKSLSPSSQCVDTMPLCSLPAETLRLSSLFGHRSTCGKSESPSHALAGRSWTPFHPTHRAIDLITSYKALKIKKLIAFSPRRHQHYLDLDRHSIVLLPLLFVIGVWLERCWRSYCCHLPYNDKDRSFES